LANKPFTLCCRLIPGPSGLMEEKSESEIRALLDNRLDRLKSAAAAKRVAEMTAAQKRVTDYFDGRIELDARGTTTGSAAPSEVDDCVDVCTKPAGCPLGGFVVHGKFSLAKYMSGAPSISMVVDGVAITLTESEFDGRRAGSAGSALSLKRIWLPGRRYSNGSCVCLRDHIDSSDSV
jgi:hypothetical protein